MLKQLALILCLHTIASPAAQAADCRSNNLSQSDMDVCAGDSFKKADAELNARYKKIVGCLKDAAKPLAEAQRAWIKFRDAECKFQGSASEGGSVQPMEVGDRSAKQEPRLLSDMRGRRPLLPDVHLQIPQGCLRAQIAPQLGPLAVLRPTARMLGRPRR